MIDKDNFYPEEPRNEVPKGLETPGHGTVTGLPGEDSPVTEFVPTDIVAWDDTGTILNSYTVLSSGAHVVGGNPFCRFGISADEEFIYVEPGAVAMGDKEEDRWWVPYFPTLEGQVLFKTAKVPRIDDGYLTGAFCDGFGELRVLNAGEKAKWVEQMLKEGRFVIDIAQFYTIPGKDPKFEVMQWICSDIIFSDIADCDPSGSSSEESSEDSEESSNDSGSGESKDSAIVPVNWTKTGYVALYTVEAPDVRFEDVAVFERPKNASSWTDSWCGRFKSVVSDGSLEVVGYSTDKPCSVGITIDQEGVLSFKSSIFPWKRPNRVVVKISGIRRGFEGVRFESKTKEEFDANEARLKLDIPRKKK